MKTILICLAALFAAQSIEAQINAEPMAFTKSFWLDENGAPCINCQIWSYNAGTTTLAPTYTTTSAAVTNTNPVQLDSRGAADIFLGQQAYKLVLELPPPSGQTHGTVVWTEDNISPLGLIAYKTTGSGISACAATYLPTYAGAQSMNLCTYLSSWIDVRTFGAVGLQGNCHSSGINDQPSIQAALNYAYANGPLDVLLPNGYCWPILTHVWVPPGVRFHGEGRTSGYEVSSPGSLLIANSGYAAANTTFPFTQMVWMTGDNFASGTYLASNQTAGAEVDHMEVNCNEQTGCGNLLGVGRQEKSTFHDLKLSGSVPANAGYSYGLYDQGYGCGGFTPPANGCLIAASGSPVVAVPFSLNEGPDYNLEISPSPTAPSANFVPYALMGGLGYKGLRDTTINCLAAAGSTTGGYFWGINSTIGPGLTIELCASAGQFYIGNIPAGSSCYGASSDLFISSWANFVIPNCASQTDLSFINIFGGITNNVSGAPVANIVGPDYYYDSATQDSGPPGMKASYYSSSFIVMKDPGEFVQQGYNPFSAYVGTAGGGFNAGYSKDLGAAYTRAYSCGNMLYNHSATNWLLGGDGSNDASCVLHLQGGGIGLYAQTTASSPVSTSTLLSNTNVVASGAGHLLVGSGWLSTSTGEPVGEGSAAIQTKGGIGGDVQSAHAAGCTTSSSAGSTCAVTVTWATSYSNSTYDVQCSGIGASGAPFIENIAPSNGSVSVTISNGQGSQAVASSYTTVSCFANSQ